MRIKAVIRGVKSTVDIYRYYIYHYRLQMSSQNTQTQPVKPLKSIPMIFIGIIAWLIPGAGHWMLGKKNRAIVIFVSIIILFFTGIYIGGNSLVNVTYAKLWYIAQIFTGLPCLIMTSKEQLGFGKGIDLGQLYTSCAGLLNLMCVIDAIIPPESGTNKNKAKEVKEKLV